MNDKEKLISLLILTDPNPYTCESESGSCELTTCTECRARSTADLLISHGVTVQEWISVEEHLPQENEPEGAICEQVQVLLDNGVVSTGWCNRHTKLWWHLNYGETDFTGCDYEHTPVIAWQPLAQPPKGE